MRRKDREVTDLSEIIEIINENAHVALDQTEYQKRYDALVARFDKTKGRQRPKSPI